MSSSWDEARTSHECGLSVMKVEQVSWSRPSTERRSRRIVGQPAPFSRTLVRISCATAVPNHPSLHAGRSALHPQLFEVELPFDRAQRLIVDLTAVAELDDGRPLCPDDCQLDLLVLDSLLAPLSGFVGMCQKGSIWRWDRTSAAHLQDLIVHR